MDKNRAERYIESIGYYRLSAYMYPLLEIPKSNHLFKNGTAFDKVIMLYRFDKKLRILLFNEIEKIEVAVREAVMNLTADRTGDMYWLTNPVHFHDRILSGFNGAVIRVYAHGLYFVGQRIFGANLVEKNVVHIQVPFY